MQPRFSITVGKGKGYVRTSILDKYEDDGQMEKIPGRDFDERGRKIYKIVRGSEEFT